MYLLTGAIMLHAQKTFIYFKCLMFMEYNMKELFALRAVIHWNTLPTGCVNSLLLEVLKMELARILDKFHLGSLSHEGLDQMIFQAAF